MLLRTIEATIVVIIYVHYTFHGFQYTNLVTKDDLNDIVDLLAWLKDSLFRPLFQCFRARTFKS